MLPIWAVSWGWCGIYIAASWLIPSKKRGRGYLTRLLGKIIPPKFLWVPPTGATYRYFIVWGAVSVLQYGLGVLNDTTTIVVFWPIVVGFIIDDWLNGDDDLKKRWESVKNKIKWKMVLPEPATQDARGA